MTAWLAWAKVGVFALFLWAPLAAAGGDEPASAAAGLWTEEGLVRQPRLAELESGRAYSFEPGSTPWQEAELPAALREGGWASPGALLLELVTALGLEASLGTATWELTLRVLEVAEDEAAGVILEWGLMDDAVAGSDWRLAMRRAGEGWRATGLERRLHCRRGVSEGLCL